MSSLPSGPHCLSVWISGIALAATPKIPVAGPTSASGKCQSARDSRALFKVNILDLAPDLATLPAKEVTKAALATRIREVRESGRERSAGKTRAYLFAAFNLALRAEIPRGGVSNPGNIVCPLAPSPPIFARSWWRVSGSYAPRKRTRRCSQRPKPCCRWIP